MFQINNYLLNKMGWMDCSHYRIIIQSPIRGLYYNKYFNSKNTYNLFQNDPLVRYFIEFENKGNFFVIKELSESEKQNSKNLYKFIKVEINKDKPIFNSEEFNSNIELLKLIKSNFAFNEEYQRHFKLNKILNNEKERT